MITITECFFITNLADKYFDEYVKEGHDKSINGEIHPFWYWLEAKFGFKINWHTHPFSITFEDEKKYLIYLLKKDPDGS